MYFNVRQILNVHVASVQHMKNAYATSALYLIQSNAISVELRLKKSQDWETRTEQLAGSISVAMFP